MAVHNGAKGVLLLLLWVVDASPAMTESLEAAIVTSTSLLEIHNESDSIHSIELQRPNISRIDSIA
jgi:hypothetical protein